MTREKMAGVIYILTNPSFQNLVKIGYASNLGRRVKELNRSESLPYAFRVYAFYEVTKSLQDKELHSIIDRLNPTLRARENFDGKIRIREFYEMSAEDAYQILESIARLSGTEDRLHPPSMTQDDRKNRDEEAAQETGKEARERRSRFSFQECGIPEGSEIVLLDHPAFVARVKNDRQIEYRGQLYSLSGLAQELLQRPHPVSGPDSWTYQGKILSELRREREGKDPCPSRLSGTEDRHSPPLMTPGGRESRAEAAPKKSGRKPRNLAAPFSFQKCGIPEGSEIVLLDHPEFVATVKNDRQIEYQGRLYSLSGLAQELLQLSYAIRGPAFWTYRGKVLSELRREREEKGLYQ